MLLIELLHDGMTIDLREIFNLLSQFLTVRHSPFQNEALETTLRVTTWS